MKVSPTSSAAFRRCSVLAVGGSRSSSYQSQYGRCHPVNQSQLGLLSSSYQSQLHHCHPVINHNYIEIRCHPVINQNQVDVIQLSSRICLLSSTYQSEFGRCYPVINQNWVVVIQFSIMNHNYVVDIQLSSTIRLSSSYQPIKPGTTAQSNLMVQGFQHKGKQLCKQSKALSLL